MFVYHSVLNISISLDLVNESKYIYIHRQKKQCQKNTREIFDTFCYDDDNKKQNTLIKKKNTNEILRRR